MRLSENFIPPVVLQSVNILQSACLKLTRGQHLDIAFEKLDVLPLDLYWQMVDGKTSSLLSACMAIGALLGGVDESVCNGMFNFGSKIGAAFQVQDDWLGVWGNDELLGKSTSSDLITRKKTYPILLGIMKEKEFSKIWNSLKSINYADSRKLANLLRQDGVEEETRSQFEVLYNEAFSIFDKIRFDPQQATPLRQVIEGLFGRIN